MKKILILSMSCNKDRYKKEEIAMLDTIGKEIEEHYDDNVKLYFYRGGNACNEILNEEHLIKLKCDDSLQGTFNKTMLAFDIVKDFEYDYLVRVNTSTFINMENLISFIEELPEKSDKIYCCRLLKCNGIIFRGNAFIISKDVVNDIYSNRNCLKSLKIDDVGISKVMRQIHKNEMYFRDEALEIPNATSYKLALTDFNHYVFIRMIEGKNDTKVCEKHYDMYEEYNKHRGEYSVLQPEKFKEIETCGGIRSIDSCSPFKKKTINNAMKFRGL